MDVRLPDGTIVRGVPDGMSRDELAAKLKANGYNIDVPAPAAEKSLGGAIAQQARNVGGGLVRGAGSIGATLIAPIDMASDAINGKGLSLESNRQRRADMDAALQNMGADTDSFGYGAGKLASEIAGTLPVGGILGKAVSGVAPRLGQAIASGGMSTGSRVAPGIANAAADMGVRVAGGAIGGGASAALVDPREAALGAAIGGALPVAVKTLGMGAQAVGSAVSPKMAQRKAVSKAAEAIGDSNVQQAIGDIQTYYPKGAENIPVSSAAITGNPRLAQLEQGSRLTSPLWFEFDQKQGRAVADNVMKATQEADQLGARMAERQENWRQAWQAASDAQKPRIWAKRMGQLGGDLDQALMSPEASNPAVRNVLEAVRDEVIRVGPSFSPSHLQQLRANLNGKVQPMSSDVFKSAPRDNPAIISLKQELDDILNVSTGGKWQKVIEGYAEDSGKVHASKAAQRVRNAFVDAETGRVRGVGLGDDVPKITEAGLNRALDAARLPDKSLALSAEANQQLGATLDALRRQNIVQQVKRTATAGGGSDTVPNAMAAGLAQSAGAPNMLMQLISGVKKMGTAKTDNELARLLSNPDELAKALDAYLRPPQPNRLAGLAARSVPVLAADQ